MVMVAREVVIVSDPFSHITVTAGCHVGIGVVTIGLIWRRDYIQSAFKLASTIPVSLVGDQKSPKLCDETRIMLLTISFDF